MPKPNSCKPLVIELLARLPRHFTRKDIEALHDWRSRSSLSGCLRKMARHREFIHVAEPGGPGIAMVFAQNARHTKTIRGPVQPPVPELPASRRVPAVAEEQVLETLRRALAVLPRRFNRLELEDRLPQAVLESKGHEVSPGLVLLIGLGEIKRTKAGFVKGGKR